MADATFTLRLSREDAERLEALARELAALRAQLAGKPTTLPTPTAFEADFGAWMEAQGAVAIPAVRLDGTTLDCAAPAAASAAPR